MVISNLTRKPFFSKDVLSNAYNLLFQQIRHGHRPNLQRPRRPHYDRVRVLAVCEPVYPPKPKNCEKEAIEMMRKKIDNPVADNPYATFLANKMRRDLTSHELAVVLHFNQYSGLEIIEIKGLLYDMNYPMKIQEKVNYNVARLALTGTKWAPIIPLLKSYSAIGYCSDNDIPRLQKALKKMPQFTLLAAITQGRILHKDAIEELGRLRDITNVRAQLSSTFALQAVTLSQNLTANVTALSHSLSTYCDGKPPQEEDSSSSSSSSSSDDDDGSSSSSSSSDSDSDTEEKNKT